MNEIHLVLFLYVDAVFMELLNVYFKFNLFRTVIFSTFNLGKSKEAEIKRINKELANIRSKFKGIFPLVTIFYI